MSRTLLLAHQLRGVDTTAAMLGAAAEATDDERIGFQLCRSYRFDLEDASTDLAVSAAFDRWTVDPVTVFAEFARVLRPGGVLMLCGTFLGLRDPGRPVGLFARSRCRKALGHLLREAGFGRLTWHDVDPPVVALTTHRAAP